MSWRHRHLTSCGRSLASQSWPHLTLFGQEEKGGSGWTLFCLKSPHSPALFPACPATGRTIAGLTTSWWCILSMVLVFKILWESAQWRAEGIPKLNRAITLLSLAISLQGVSLVHGDRIPEDPQMNSKGVWGYCGQRRNPWEKFCLWSVRRHVQVSSSAER